MVSMANESHHQDIRNRISFIMPDGEYYDSHYLGVQTDYEEAGGGGALSRMSSFVAKKLSPKPQQKVSSLSSSNTILLSKR